MVVKKRSDYLDVLRAIAIILVVFIHSVDHMAEIYHFDDNLSACFLHGFLKAIGRMGVPIFFMVSGALLLGKNISILSFYKRRLPRIILSLMFVPLIYEIFCASVLGYPAYTLVVPKSFAGNPGYAYHLWFLYTTMGIYLAAPFIQKFIESGDKYIILCYIFISFFIGFIPRLINSVVGVTLPYVMMDFFNPYVTYFIVGYFLHRLVCDVSKSHVLLLVMLLSFCIPSVLLCFYEMPNENFTDKSNLLLWHDKPFIFVASFCLFLLVKKWCGVGNVRKIKMFWVRKISSSSYTIYLFHIGVISAYKTLLPKGELNFYVSVIILTVFCLVLCFILNVLIKRIPFFNKFLT